ncbi:unnamed protein product, partial [Prorocentrum cordatum]
MDPQRPLRAPRRRRWLATGAAVRHHHQDTKRIVVWAARPRGLHGRELLREQRSPTGITRAYEHGLLTGLSTGRVLNLKRKPDEHQFSYNARTSARITSWLTLYSIKPLYIRVLTAVYKSAWRDQSKSLQDWMREFPSFANSVSVAWDLPDVRKASAIDSEPAPPAVTRLRVERYTLDELPAAHAMPNFTHQDFQWDCEAGLFVIVCDCKPVVDILMGCTSPLASVLHHLPAFHRVSDQLAQLVERGRYPHQAWMDPLVWKRRELNQRADHLVNATMDMQKSWQHVEPKDPDFKLEDANVEIHCDGGRKGSQAQALGVLPGMLATSVGGEAISTSSALVGVVKAAQAAGVKTVAISFSVPSGTEPATRVQEAAAGAPAPNGGGKRPAEGPRSIEVQ